MSGVEQLLREGIVAAQLRQFERARPLLERATAEAPQDPTGWFWRAIVSAFPDDAVDSLRRVVAIDASHELAQIALAKLLFAEAHRAAAAGRRADARALAAEGTRRTPDAQPMWVALATLTVDPLERIDALRRAIDLAPDQLHLRMRLRQALLARGVMASVDRIEARACFREAAELDPRDPRVWHILAKLADSPAEASDALRELLRVAPHDAAGRSALRAALMADAQELATEGHINKACERWREAIALTGGDIDTWLGLAAVTTDRAETGRALEAAYARCPDDPRVAEAMERLHSRIEPHQAVPPADAFARFEIDSTEVSLDAIDGEDPLAQLESSLTALAVQPPAEAAPAARPREEPSARAQDWIGLDVDGEADPAPAPVPDAPIVEAPIVDAPLAAAPAPVGRRTVMVVDDSPTIRKILGLTLDRAGYDVVAEPDGESALARLAEIRPDLILLDIAMPKLDGYEVCRQIKQNPRTADVPVVMLSGKGALFDKVKGHIAGAAEYLTKPFETPAVLAVVMKHCERPAETVNG